jgi:hypothetical protein
MISHITRSGWLTLGALACGYVETVQSARYSLTLWLEHGCLHVRLHDHKEDGRLFWVSPASLSEARKLFSRTARELKVKRVMHTHLAIECV